MLAGWGTGLIKWRGFDGRVGGAPARAHKEARNGEAVRCEVERRRVLAQMIWRGFQGEWVTQVSGTGSATESAHQADSWGGGLVAVPLDPGLASANDHARSSHAGHPAVSSDGQGQALQLLVQ